MWWDERVTSDDLHGTRCKVNELRHHRQCQKYPYRSDSQEEREGCCTTQHVLGERSKESPRPWSRPLKYIFIVLHMNAMSMLYLRILYDPKMSPIVSPTPPPIRAPILERKVSVQRTSEWKSFHTLL
jgi:hypothetical protein